MKDKISGGFNEIHKICEDRGRVLKPTFPYRICIDSGIKVASVCSSPSVESARLKAREKALKHEAWLEKLGIPTLLHGFSETMEASKQAKLDISNHPHGMEANSAYARYEEEIAGNVAIVLKESLANLPFHIGKGVRKLEPITVPRPSKTIPIREQVSSLRAATKTTGKDTLQRIQDGEKVLTFIEGSRSKSDGNLLKFQKSLVEPSIDFLQEKNGEPSLLVVKTACINGALPHRYEDMINPRKKAPVYQTPIHYYRDILDISGKNIDDILAEARNIMEKNLIHGIDLSLETLNK